jgi:glutamate/aspartate transport system substrate-binding protein
MPRVVVRAAWRLLAAVATVWAAMCAPAKAVEGTTLSRIAKAGVINVGYIPTPGTFAFRNEAGETVGYSIDLCMKVVESVRKTLNRADIRVAFRPLEASQRIPLLKSGAIDIECGGNTNTVARQRDVDFSYTFFTTGVRFLAKKPCTIERAASLWRRRIAAPKGTTAQDVVTRFASEQQVEPVLVANDLEGLRLVEAGAVAAFAQDDILLYGLAASSSLKNDIEVCGKFMTVEPYSFMLPKDDAAFREVVDKTLLSMMQSGELEAAYRKWFETARLRAPMNAYMRENLRYPNKYGIP